VWFVKKIDNLKFTLENQDNALRALALRGKDHVF
jgi:hypothetical protein